jgi:pimeloyl-ACP methyl ester carboxylesterase
VERGEPGLETRRNTLGGLLGIICWLFGGALVVAVVLAAVGAAYQAISESTDLKRFPPPGKLIDIGGRRLHLHCAGTINGPAVVIEAGAGSDSTLWDDIVHSVSSFTRACTYDRAGLGWSDPAPSPRSFDDRAGDLHAVLARAGIAGPLILVGHSYGGYIVRTFAKIYRDRVAGIVLVDAAEEGYTFDPWGLKSAAQVRAREYHIGWAVRLGLLRIGLKLWPDRFDPVKSVPPSVRAEMTALYLRSSRHFAAADELAAYERTPQSTRQPGGFGLLGDLPLIVVSRSSRDEATGKATSKEWLAAQDRLVALSTNSAHIVAERSGHMIQFGEPELLVDAIERLWDEARRDDRGMQGVSGAAT